MIFSVLTQKGGVGKTTLCFNLAAAFLESHPSRSFALVDLDDQESLYRFRRAHKNGDKSLKNLEFYSAHLEELPALLEKLRPKFDHILMDAPRSLDDALCAAILGLCDGVLIPMQPEYDALLAAKRTMQVAEKVGEKRMKRGLPNLRARVVLSQNSHATHRAKIKIAARELFEEKLCRAAIPAAPIVGLAAMEAQSVLFSAPKSPVAQAFRRLAREMEGAWWL